LPRPSLEPDRHSGREIALSRGEGPARGDTEPPDELIGRSIGSYRITRLLGAGGMGAVYLAEHPAIGSRVAIKFLHPRYAADRKIVDRFFNEARAVNVIGHDNILKILDLDVTPDNRHYFVMEFLHGRSLQDLPQPGAPLPLDVAGPILLQVCDALQAAHDRRIVHRDLKPGNVYLTVHRGRKNFVKLVDFGIARVGDRPGSAGATQTGLVMGTPAYMSPEQASGLNSRIDGRSDVYSLGCMMFQMATGSVPFPEASFGEVLVGHLTLPPPRPRKLQPAVPEAYEAVILRCLEKKPEDRYQSMREVHGAIARVMDALGTSRELPLADAADLAEAAEPARALAAPGKPRRSPPKPRSAGVGWWAGAGAGALAIASGVALLVAQQAEDRRREAERAAQIAAGRTALQAREAARRAQEEQARASEGIQLSVVSDPAGAVVEAVWSGGVKAAVTPFELSVPKNASVRFAFSKRDFVSFTTEVVADSPKVVRATLLAQAKAAPPRRAAKKARQASAEMKDDTIPVEF
jgi:tRNA A-37 threonylcarbamoyl transferase component Bud32